MNSQDKTNLDGVFSSSDVVDHGRFIRHSFDGLPTGMTATVSEIMDVFLQQQSQMIQYMLSDIATHGDIKKNIFYRIVDRVHIYLQKKGIFFFVLEKFQQKGNNDFYRGHAHAKDFSGSYKIWIYNSKNTLADETIEWFDSEIMSYFRQLWYDVSIDYQKWYSAWVTTGLCIKICSK